MAEELGLFDSGTTATITGVTPKQLRYWVETGIIVPARQVGEKQGKRYFFDFLNLISIRTVVALRHKSLPLQRIRKAISVLNQEYAVSRPLENLSLFTDGQSVFVVGDNPELVFDVLRRGQAVFAVAIDDIVGDLARRLNLSVDEITAGCDSLAWSIRSAAR